MPGIAGAEAVRAAAAAAAALDGLPSPPRSVADRRRRSGAASAGAGRVPHRGRGGLARAALASLLAWGPSACAFPTREAFDAQMAAFVGRSEAELVAALGVPVRTHEAGGFRFLEYERRRVVGTPAGVGAGFGRFGYPYGYGYGFGYGGTFVDTRECATTFTLRAGRVEGFSRRGNDCRAYPAGGAP